MITPGDTITVSVRGERLTGVVVRVPEGDGYGALHGDGGELVTWTAGDVVEHRRANGEATTWAGPRQPDPLHPNGKCACAGEGRCEWCLRTRIAELEAETRDWKRAAALETQRSDRLEGELAAAIRELRDTSPAYLAGKRDQLAIEQHQDALVADVLRTADAWERVPGIKLTEAMDACGVLIRAIEAWRAAGRPGLPGGEHG